MHIPRAMPWSTRDLRPKEMLALSLLSRGGTGEAQKSVTKTGHPYNLMSKH
jgi:hypothetical protein